MDPHPPTLYTERNSFSFIHGCPHHSLLIRVLEAQVCRKIQRNFPVRTWGRYTQEWNFLGESFAQCVHWKDYSKKDGLNDKWSSEREGNWMSRYSSLTPFECAVRRSEESIAPTRASLHHQRSCPSLIGLLPGGFLPRRSPGTLLKWPRHPKKFCRRALRKQFTPRRLVLQGWCFHYCFFPRTNRRVKSRAKTFVHSISRSFCAHHHPAFPIIWGQRSFLATLADNM